MGDIFARDALQEVKMKTITIYDARTGELGPVISGHPDDLPKALASIDGAHDSSKKIYNLETGELDDRPPQPPHINELRQARNEMLDDYRWTIMPDSPLTDACQQAWMIWLKKLHSLLLNVTDTSTVVWPEKPELEYKTEN